MGPRIDLLSLRRQELKIEDRFSYRLLTTEADVTVKQPRCAQDLLLLSIATPEPIGSYAQMGWYDVWSPYKP